MTLKSAVDELSRRFDKYSPWPKHYAFIMSPEEQALFDSTIKNAQGYLEFGMGGSTFRALLKSKAKVYSVDSSRAWMARMRNFWLIRFMEMKGRLFVFHADIGPTREWGIPTGNNNDIFPNYSAAVFRSIPKENIDTVLVDGRFRVACVLKTILECASNKNLRILIHDFWVRERYHAVLHYLDSVACADTLGIFKIKAGIDLDAVQQDYEAYKFNHA